MLYLLDANVLIQAHEDYYPLDRIPQFWDWLITEAIAGYVKNALVLDEEVDRTLFNQTLDTAYAPDLTDHELEQVGRDPFLVAYGLMGPNRAIVTKEISKPSRVRGRRKLPDACDIMHVPWMTDFQFYSERNFRIP